MAFEVTIPEVGESITEGFLAEWSQPDGAVVAIEDPLLVLETDKITMNINAEQAGRLQILVAEGETVQVGQVVATIDTENSSATTLIAGRPQPMFSSEISVFVPTGSRISPTPDAQKFLIAHTPDENQPRSVRVVVNWFTELRQN